MTIDEKTRRLFGIAVGSRAAAGQVCDAIENAAHQMAYSTVDAVGTNASATTSILAAADDVTVSKLVILPQGDFVGIDDSDVVTLTFKVGDTSVAALEISTLPDGSLIEVDVVAFALAAEGVLSLLVETGTTAQTPRLLVGSTFTID